MEDPKPVTFVSAKDAFKPQVKVTMTRDVNGYVNRARRIKWHLAAGQTYYVDEEKAVELIVKGYAHGELPRAVSDGEREEFESQKQVIRLG